jgi:hypothetical protein
MRALTFVFPFNLCYIILYKITNVNANVLPFPEPSYTKQLLLLIKRSLHTVY